MGQGQRQAGEAALGAPHGDRAEAGPIDLALLGREGPRAQEGLARLGTQLGRQAALLDDAPLAAALSDHLEQAGGAQGGIALQGLAHELDGGIGQAGPADLVAVEALGAQGTGHRVPVQAQLAGNGSDPPVHGVEKATDLGRQLGVDHGSPPLEGVDEAARTAAAQAARLSARRTRAMRLGMAVLPPLQHTPN